MKLLLGRSLPFLGLLTVLAILYEMVEGDEKKPFTNCVLQMLFLGFLCIIVVIAGLMNVINSLVDLSRPIWRPLWGAFCWTVLAGMMLLGLARASVARPVPQS